MKRALSFLLPLLLLLLTACDGGREREMETLLDRADSLNRAYIPMTGGLDSLLLEATRYYDRHGSANQQMRAHYLLGCAYRDMGEAPAALQSYQDAVDRADTTSSNCDYRQLMKVYGQMAELYDAQNLPNDELDAIFHVHKCAELIEDTLTSIRCVELQVKPYFLLGDTASTLRVLEEARQLYLSHGYRQEAASVFASVIDHYLSKGDIDEAGSLMKVFEEDSGLFDEAGNIDHPREIYYYIKATYSLKKKEYGKAEYYYRKLCETHEMEAYKGLANLYRIKGVTDSLVKYTFLFESALDTLHNKMRTDVVHQMTSMYNYQRFKRETAKEAEKARHTRMVLYAVLALIVIAIGVCWYLVRRYREKEKAKADRMLTNYVDVQTKLKRLNAEYTSLKTENEGLSIVCNDVERLKQDNKMLNIANLQMFDELVSLKNDKGNQLKEKETEICQLREDLERSEKELRQINLYNQFSIFSSSKIVHDIRNKRKLLAAKAIVSRTEWKKLIKQFHDDMPLASAVLSRNAKLTDKELYVCIMVILGFRHDEIMRLMPISAQSLTNFKSSANKKLFNIESASSLNDNLEKALWLKRPGV